MQGLKLLRAAFMQHVYSKKAVGQGPNDGLIGHFVHGRLIMEGECVIFFGIISYSRVEFVRLAWRFNWRADEVSLD